MNHTSVTGWGGELTYEDVVNDPLTTTVKNFAIRNTRKLAYVAAKALGLNINYTVDSSTYTANSWEAEDFVASEQHLVPISTIERDPVNKCISFYNMATPIRNIQSKHFILTSPYDGIVEVNMPDKSNIIAGYLHSTTGRKTPAESLQTAHKSIRERNKGFTWDNHDITYTNNTKLHKDAYNDFDESHIQALVKAGWEEKYGYEKYIPLVVKISANK